MTEFLGLPRAKYLMFGLNPWARLQPCHWESLFFLLFFFYSTFSSSFASCPSPLTESVPSPPNPPGCGYLRVGAIQLVANHHQ